MPKKHQPKALLTKPSSSVPAHFSSSSKHLDTSRNEPKQKRTVNALIQELRRADLRDGKGVQAAILASVHPALRDALSIPDPPERLPRNHFRGPASRRRIPGPPPPRSWLVDSIHGPGHDLGLERNGWVRSRVQHQSSILPGIDLPQQDSLIHLVLKRMAISWSWHAEYDHTYIATLPVRLREALLSYVAIYDFLHWPNPLPFLFPGDMGTEESFEVRRLDLSNALGTWTTMKAILKFLQKPGAHPTENSSAEAELPESWDLDDESALTSISGFTSSHLRFANLKHLSLALNPESSTSGASWSGLIALANEVSTILSLSIAYWPQPTYTPNASKGRFKVQNSTTTTLPSVTYGGSNFYTAFDNDWREAAGILRSLSRALYCLEWLDLTGCGEWYSALVWSPPPKSDEEDDGEVWKSSGPDWNGSWRGLHKLIMAVGWQPAPELDDDMSSTSDGLSLSSETFIKHQEALDRLSNLRLGENANQAQDWDTRRERRKYYHQKEMERYQEARRKARDVAQEIRCLRQGHGGHWIEFDYGESYDF